MRLRATLISLTALLAAFPGPAAAAEPALAAPGAPMRMVPKQPPATVTTQWGESLKVPPNAFNAVCTQGPVGTVGAQKVMLTASHCLHQLPGMPETKGEVSVPLDRGYTRIGQRGQSNHVPVEAMTLADPALTVRTADWGIVLLDDAASTTRLTQSRPYTGGAPSEPATLTYVRDFRTLAPGEWSLDNAGQPICKDGATTGRSCGTQLARNRDGIFAWGLGYQQGDSGGVNYDPRDGAVLGVSSMVLGPLSKAQAADRIVEEAYGVPDGQVNEHFKLTESTAPHADFLATGEEAARAEQQIAELNPDFREPDPRAELDRAVANAQQEAVRLGEQAMRGQFNPAEIERAVDHHSNQISLWGGLAAQAELQRQLG